MDLLAQYFSGLVALLPGDLPRKVEDEFHRGWHREKVEALIHQQHIAKTQPVRRLMDGLGQVMMSMDPTIYHYWGQRLGYQCWRDKRFRREIMRDNPQVRVKSQSCKVTIVRP